MPGYTPLGSLFGKSPIGPIQEHMQVVNEAAEQLPAFFSASEQGDWRAAAAHFKEIRRAERAGDKLKRSVRRHLPQSLFMPVPRGDLLELITAQDEVANIAKDIGGLMLGRQMQFPESLQEPLMELVETCAETISQTTAAIRELEELLEAGFTGREVKRVEGMIRVVAKLEGRTDKQAEALRGKLFKMESELPPVEVMFYYKILDLLTELADTGERVSHQLQVLIAK